MTASTRWAMVSPITFPDVFSDAEFPPKAVENGNAFIERIENAKDALRSYQEEVAHGPFFG